MLKTEHTGDGTQYRQREGQAIPGRKSALSQQLSSWKGLIFVLNRFASSQKAVLFFFSLLCNIILHWTPTYMCFSWKTCSPTEWFPLHQTWALSNFFDFLQHFRGGFWSLSDSGSICWHILGLLQTGRINSQPFLCIFSALSHKTALELSELRFSSDDSPWQQLLTTCSSLVTTVRVNPAFPYNSYFFHASCIVCFLTFLLSFESEHIKIKIPRPNVSFFFLHSMLWFRNVFGLNLNYVWVLEWVEADKEER